MKNLKINKLAENRLNEKEMRDLMGGAWEYVISCPPDPDADCCGSMCYCDYFSILNISNTGNINAYLARRPVA